MGSEEINFISNKLYLTGTLHKTFQHISKDKSLFCENDVIIPIFWHKKNSDDDIYWKRYSGYFANLYTAVDTDSISTWFNRR